MNPKKSQNRSYKNDRSKNKSNNKELSMCCDVTKTIEIRHIQTKYNSYICSSVYAPCFPYTKS